MNLLLYVSSALALLLGLYGFYIKRLVKRKLSFGPRQRSVFGKFSKALLGSSIVSFVLGTFYIGIGLASAFSWIEGLDICLQLGVFLDSLAFAALSSSFLFREMSIQRSSLQDDRNDS